MFTRLAVHQTLLCPSWVQKPEPLCIYLTFSLKVEPTRARLGVSHNHSSSFPLVPFHLHLSLHCFLKRCEMIKVRVGCLASQGVLKKGPTTQRDSLQARGKGVSLRGIQAGLR